MQLLVVKAMKLNETNCYIAVKKSKSFLSFYHFIHEIRLELWPSYLWSKSWWNAYAVCTCRQVSFSYKIYLPASSILPLLLYRITVITFKWLICAHNNEIWWNFVSLDYHTNQHKPFLKAYWQSNSQLFEDLRNITWPPVRCVAIFNATNSLIMQGNVQ